MTLSTATRAPTTRAGRPRATTLLPLVLLLSAMGCAAEAPDTAGRFDSLDVANAEALPTIPHDAWVTAPAGCEGRNLEAAGFGVAEGEPDLVVALDPSGAIICADTYPALESELTDSELTDEADRLWLGYLATLQDPELSNVARREAIDMGWDPTPQPNLVAHQGGVNAIDDPSHQTNDSADLMPDVAPDDAAPDVDPTPQPNNPSQDAIGSEDSSLSDGSLRSGEPTQPTS
ncbi:MAG: hypothetical protein GXP55_21850 [Deltaproteobacteria bacterium]|nr:hypothetical protein [Deltaproteobacteria bacterium]